MTTQTSSAGGDSARVLVEELISLLDPSAVSMSATAASPRQRRTTLAHILTTRPPAPLAAYTARKLDQLLTWETQQRSTVEPEQLTRLRAHSPGSCLSLWEGDITTLATDAIVNAANNQMLGCFLPGHACIDNAIHAAAGPQLRAACAEHMTKQGHLEPTGTATLTPAFHLPARYVLHTVGPVVTTREPTTAHAAALTSCYKSCLDVASRSGDVASIAFCAISTGVFGYPIHEAAEVAVDAVIRWLDAHPSNPMHVIFNTFSDRDTAAYGVALESRLQ